MRRNINNEMSEWLVTCGVAVAVIIALSVVAYHQRSIWATEKALQSPTEAPQSVLILETPNISAGLERVQ